MRNKDRLLSNHLFQRMQEHGGWKKPINFSKKTNVFELPHGIKNITPSKLYQ